MSGYENVVGGKLRLKGKALDVKAGGMKKKKQHMNHHDPVSQAIKDDLATGKIDAEPTDPNEEDIDDGGKSSREGKAASYDDHLTPIERRYIEQREKLDIQKMAKDAKISHRDRIQDFNQYLANLSEHYDIPKVGPG